MTKKLVSVSDLSGDQLKEGEAGKLVVTSHPELPESSFPLTLEARDEEFNALPTAAALTMEWHPSGGGTTQRVAMTMADLAQHPVLAEAIAQQAVAQRNTSNKQVDYSSAEHAGRPHRGRITDAEKRAVRRHLAHVNRRLRDEGHPEIDPNDPVAAARYGFAAPDETNG